MGSSNAEENEAHGVARRRSATGGDVRKLLRDDETTGGGSGPGAGGETGDARERSDAAGETGTDGDMEWVRSSTGSGESAGSADGAESLPTEPAGVTDPLEDMPAFVKRILPDDKLEAIRRGEAERPEWTRA